MYPSKHKARYFTLFLPKFKKQAVIFTKLFAKSCLNLTACPLAVNQRKYHQIFGGLSALFIFLS
ncbi:hypothetical protein X808_3370 [Mannheimia varigena USDA-ARS-USMARC-1296]|uniref:Uncharacterized protein n=1 Tax=Mannheimia varigena USDA-ARS-USMARC-1296 TaxID=1433287 RepID=W0Q7J3_9PAST|nr:hypothetical protein X808_3370 [Mannheimia varigena USDA-ARS-USMARC-1296]